MKDFSELGLSQNVLDALAAKGFTTPTPIQAKTVPMIMGRGVDIVGRAMTGTGKTAAFGLPIIDSVEPATGHVRALVLAPTRELAMQVAREIESLKGKKPLRVLSVYGGQAMWPQMKDLRRGVDIVVGTPGRVLDHLRRGTLILDHLDYFVLDEADEMCAMGFIDDVREILKSAGPDRRVLLFSATMPPEVLRIASDFMHDYEVVEAESDQSDLPPITQYFHEVMDRDRFEALCRIIDAAPGFYGLVFCRTRSDTALVAERLAERGVSAEAIHGDLSQARREEILARFRKGSATVLVATDVAARGIDVPDLTHIVNFALPQSPEVYVHRMGRTGRAGKDGAAVSIITPGEFRKMIYIGRSIGVRIEKRPMPRVEDVIKAKKARLLADFEAALADDPGKPCLDLAQELLDGRDPVEVLASVLAKNGAKALDPKTYRRLESSSKPARGGGGAGGRVQFKAAMGRAHGMTPRKFVDMICRKARIQPYKIQNVRIFGRDSVFTVPECDARAVMQGLGRDCAPGRGGASARH